MKDDLSTDEIIITNINENKQSNIKFKDLSDYFVNEKTNIGIKCINESFALFNETQKIHNNVVEIYSAIEKLYLKQEQDLKTIKSSKNTMEKRLLKSNYLY
jgi:hypothetical protein